MLQYYELFYIIPVSVTEEQTPEVIGAVHSIIVDAKGAVISEDNQGKKKLAYPIKHQRHGTYVLVEFDADAQAVKEIDRKLRLNTDVLRFLLTKRVIKSEAQLQREKDLQEKLRAKRKAELEKAKEVQAEAEVAVQKPDGKVKVKELLKDAEEKIATEKASSVKTKKKTAAKPELNLEELDKQLDKILDEDVLE